MAVEEKLVTEVDTDDDVYGGVFDIAARQSWESSAARLNSTLLFFDHIVIPDSFFTAKGHLSRQLLKEIMQSSHSQPEGRLLSYFKSKLFSPSLRKGEHVSDVWFDGSDYGVAPGMYQYLDSQAGDMIFGALRSIPMANKKWPQAMAAAQTTSFGELLNKYLLNSEFGLPDVTELERSLKHGWSGAPFTDDIKKTCENIDAFKGFLENRKSDPKFRRGEIENFLANQLGFETFNYSEAWNTGVALPSHATRGLLRSISSVYQANQASNFGLSILFSEDLDYVVSADWLQTDAFANGAIASNAFELAPEIDFANITAADIVEIRRYHNEAGENLFEKAKSIRKRLVSDQSGDAFEVLTEFLYKEYIPLIQRKAPQSLGSVANKIARRSKGPLEFVSNRAVELSAMSVYFGGTAIGLMLGAPNVAKAIAIAGVAGHTGVRIIIAGLEWTEQTFVFDPKRERAITQLRKDLSSGSYQD